MTSAPIGRKPGRPTDASLAIYRAMFGDIWSERTIARYVRCVRRLQAMGITGDTPEFQALHRKVTRRNGTMSVLHLDEITESIAAMRMTRWITAEGVL